MTLEQHAAHAALVSHGWTYAGLVAPGVRAYTHDRYPGQIIHLSPSGAVEHHGPGRDGRPYTHRMKSPADLARHLAGFHDDRSIADRHLPGRRDD
jgi:hypothetical protein